jgi:tripeptide aminopeptidase
MDAEEQTEPRYPSSCVERFLRYVAVDTRSDPAAEAYPSTPGQLELLRRLAAELTEMGAAEVAMDEHGYVTATLPPTSPKAGVPVIGFVAHVDTSPEMPGHGVKPLVHRRYGGGEIALPDDPAAVLRPGDDEALRAAVGQDLVTASGTTLLGADDKAGVAEIMGAAEYLLAHPEVPHGPIRLAFTPDEEVGRGTAHFDVGRFGARYAYTVDGGGAGELEAETFSADALTVVFQGFNCHPGYAKGKMVNAIKVAADFLGRLPRAGLSPEITDGQEGFVHPYQMEAGVDRTRVKLLIRDFATAGLADKEVLLEGLAREAAAAWPGSTVSFEVEESYRNMREVIDHHPEVVAVAEEAIRRSGQTPVRRSIRGGTDGSKLSFMGLPTPNLAAGQHNIHSRLEWASIQEMHKAVEVIIEIARLFAERA